MKIFPTLPLAIAAILLSATAGAQLKAPDDQSKAATAPAAAAKAAPAAAAPAALNPNAATENAAAMAAAGWLVLLDRRDWGNAWESSSSVFRNTVPLATWMEGIPKVRESFGVFSERTASKALYQTTLPGHPDGEYVTVIFESKYEKAKLQEILTTVHDADGKWRVTGYSTR